MKLDWTEEQMKITHGGLAVLERLYGKGPAGWKPILHHCDYGWHKDWSPRCDVGRPLPRLEDCEYYSVWGGMVENYSRGYEHQPVQLVFCAIDVDRDGNHNAGISVPSVVAAALPEAYVRVSTGGLGAHCFLVLNAPIFCSCRSAAAELSQRILIPYIARLHDGGIEHICSTINPLKVWSVGGSQRDDSLGGYIDVDLAALPPAPSYSCAGRGSGRAAVKLGDCGDLTRRIIAALRIPVGAQGELPSKWSCHVKAAQRSLRGLLQFETSSSGTKLFENNAFVAISERGVALFSGPDGIGSPVFSIDIDL